MTKLVEKVLSYLFIGKWKWHDFLRYQNPIIPSILKYMYLASKVLNKKKYSYLLAFHRITYDKWAEREIVSNIQSISDWARESCSIIDTINEERLFIRRTIIIKDVELNKEGFVKRKGIAIITFTTTFPYALKSNFIKRLLKEYIIVLEPSWSGYALPEILAWITFDDKVIVQATEPKDYNFLRSLESNLIPVNFGASDWVDHRVFAPMPGMEKRYDSVLVGNCSYVKRIHVYLKAIKSIGQESYNGALVLGEWGQFYDRIISLVEFYGLKNNIKIFKNLTPSALNQLYNQSKCNVLLSLKEGSNRVIFEGFFANTPGIVLIDNVGVNKSYLNEHTGLLVSECDLRPALEFMKDNFDQFSPRSWAMNSISCENTTKKLLSVVERHIDPLFSQVSPDLILVKVNRPEVEFLEADREKSASDAVLNQLIGVDPYL